MNNGSIDLSGGWSRLWSAIQSALGSGITTLMLVLGVLLVSISFFTWMWKRRRGGQGMGDMSGVWWTMAVGAVLAGPQIIIPGILTIADGIINAALNIIRLGGG